MNLFTIQAINATIIEEVRDILTNEYDEDDLFRATAYLEAAMNMATGSKVSCKIYKDRAVCTWIGATERDELDNIENMEVTMPLCKVIEHEWVEIAHSETCIITIL